jgi:hypothetical protein
MKYYLISCLLLIYTNLAEAGSPSSLKVCKKLEKQLGYSGISSVENRVSPVASAALDDYKSIYFSSINKLLRQEKYNFANSHLHNVVDNTVLKIHLLDTIFYSFPALPKNLFLFRGNSLGHRDHRPYPPESTLTEFAYVSTSVDIKVAEKFSHSADKSEVGQVMAIYFSKGLKQKGIVLCDEKEAEVLLPRKLDFKVMDEITMDNSNVTLSLVQLCRTANTCEFDVSKDVAKVWEKIKREQLEFINDI